MRTPTRWKGLGELAGHFASSEFQKESLFIICYTAVFVSSRKAPAHKRGLDDTKNSCVPD